MLKLFFKRVDHVFLAATDSEFFNTNLVPPSAISSSTLTSPLEAREKGGEGPEIFPYAHRLRWCMISTPGTGYIVGPATSAKADNPGLTGEGTYLDPGQEFHFDCSVDYEVIKDLKRNSAHGAHCSGYSQVSA